jgi:hypothetical protein
MNASKVFSFSKFLSLVFYLVLVASPRARSLQVNYPDLNLGKWGTLFSESGSQKKFFLLSANDGQVRMSVLKDGNHPAEFNWQAKAYKISDDRIVIANSEKMDGFLLVHLSDLRSERIQGPEGLQARQLGGMIPGQEGRQVTGFGGIDVVSSYSKDEIFFLGRDKFAKYSLSQRTWETMPSRPEGPSFGYDLFEGIEGIGAFLWGPLEGFQIWDGANWRGVGWGRKLRPKTDSASDIAVGSTASFVAVKMKTMSGASLYFFERAKIAKLDRQSNFEDYLIESLPSTAQNLRNIDILDEGRCIVLYNTNGSLDFQMYDRLTGRWSGPGNLNKGVSVSRDSIYLSPDIYIFEPSKLRSLKVIDQTIGRGENHSRITCPESQPLPNPHQPTVISLGFNLEKVEKNIRKSEGESSQDLHDRRKKLIIAGFSLLIIFWLLERLTKTFIARARRTQLDEDEGNNNEQVVSLSVFEDRAALATKSIEVKTSDHNETTRGMRLKSHGLTLFHYLYICVSSLFFVNYNSKSLENLITQTPFAFLATVPLHNVSLLGLLIGTFFYIGRVFIERAWVVAITVTSLGLFFGLMAVHWPLEFLIFGICLGFLMTIPAQVFGHLWELSNGSNILRFGLLSIGPMFLILTVELYSGLYKKISLPDATTEVCDMFENSSYFADCNAHVGSLTGRSQSNQRWNWRPDWRSAWALSHRDPNLCIVSMIQHDEVLRCLLQYSAAFEPKCELISENYALTEYTGPSGMSWIKNTTKLVKECETIIQGDKPCAESGLSAITESTCQTLRAIKMKDVGQCPKEWFNNIACHRHINFLREDRPRLVRPTNPYVNEPFCEEDAKNPVCLARLSAISGESKYCNLITEKKEQSICRYLSLITLSPKKQLTGSWIKDQCQELVHHLPNLSGKCEKNIKEAHGLK